MQEQEYDGIWIRWIHEPWENEGDWRTGIQENTLHKEYLKTALFILEDHRCIFVSMNELRKAIGGNPLSTNDSILFSVNPRLKTIDGKRAKMDVVVSGTHKRENTFHLFKFGKGNENPN